MKKSLLQLNIATILLGILALSLPTFASNEKNLPIVDNHQSNINQIADASLVQTQYGMIKGQFDKINNVIVWTGIPYAKSPVGQLRWKKPVDPESWKGVLDATQASKIAFQLKDNKVIGSDDSLNLNIYRPNNKSNNLPVLVYIHGGNNQNGKAEEMTGNTLVNDIEGIFVSINYRLGPLGFNPLPALQTGDKLEDSGNYALLDIAKSLDWIKENITHFGGDANNITVSGFSAGGRDVMAMLISPIFKGKFQKAISFSGGMTIADKQDSVKVFAKAIAPLVVEDKIKPTQDEAYHWLLTNNSNVRTYLYSVSSQRLVSLMGNAGIRMSVFPHLYNDGYVIPKDGFNTHEYNSVPLIMLTGTGEFSLFAQTSPYFSDTFNNDLPTGKKLKEFNFANKYGGRLYDLFNVADSAQKMAPFYKAKIYGLEIEFGQDSNSVGSHMALFGAFHGVFLPLLDADSQNYDRLIGNAYKTQGAKQLSMTLKKYLNNFIHSGDPNGTDLVYWNNWTTEHNKANNAYLYMNADKVKAIAYMGGKKLTYSDVLNEMDDDQSINQKTKKVIISEVLNGRWFSSELDQRYNNKSLWIK
ncbi:carboxylesterase family protein [Gilliamella sp. B2840]|uniref:carboxylesterase family protein n=1 Tax=unclassified Gilliamella TaxID=2685620 RepID=UPI00226A74CF|nr:MULTISPECIES: carboxylesterase family protein [unclassified Gilliamella]MCX8656008.1 carboxylesterase family protein [Gilliamella sp. B2894]MCX8664111.1 carboxylesterase family protein [Gilliamella sp. B2887]MCX8693846.1 carboxylesterase family protein [Gilliamella sp. B2881]MCX8695046.1 carboxylesterase family protein [Gilliamella sp. B2828]MCX8698992.1 carboxylesterase family protein [Gilliamella sp. B3000]